MVSSLGRFLGSKDLTELVYVVREFLSITQRTSPAVCPEARTSGTDRAAVGGEIVTSDELNSCHGNGHISHAAGISMAGARVWRSAHAALKKSTAASIIVQL